MTNFVRRTLLFLLPILILCGAVFYVYEIAKDAGEFGTVEEYSAKQKINNDILVGLGYNEQTELYKLINANEYEADVIALGTSRAMEFEAEYFTSSFYNCGGAVNNNYDEYLNFLENLNYTPKIIILDLDVWVFNANWNSKCVSYEEYQPIAGIDRTTKSIIKEVIKDRIDKKWTKNDLQNYPDNIGFNGKIKQNGYRYDGSYYYGFNYNHIENTADYQFADTLSRIENGDQRFEFGNEIDAKSIELLTNLLEYCKEKNIYVVGYLSPFPPTVFDEMMSSGNYEYVSKIYPACKKVFDSYEYELFDYINGGKLGVGDDYFVDGLHGSEVYFAMIVQDMLANHSKLEGYVDKTKLEEMVDNRYSGFTFFEP